MKTKYTAFRCPIDLLKKAKVRAALQRRSLSNYFVVLIEKDTLEKPVDRGSRTKARKR